MSGAPADVLVVGAGPAGSATAIHLARAGHRVVLLDRATFPRDKACSEYLSPDALRLLDRLGALTAVEPLGRAVSGLRVFASHGASLTGRFAAAPVTPFREAGLSVARHRLDAVLVAVARDAGVTVHEGVRVEELLYDDGAVAGVVARRGSEPTTFRARLTVGADGLRSRVARRLGRLRSESPRRLAFVAHVPGVDGFGDPTAPAEMHVRDGAYVGLNPIGGGLTNVALVVPAHRAVAARGDVARYVRRELERFPEVNARVSDRLARPWLATGPFGTRPARVIADGALLVGDAAGFFDPFTGEGIWTALRGAELAAAAADGALRLTRGVVRAEALSGYPSARRSALTGKWIVERLIGHTIRLPPLFDRAVQRIGRRRGMADTLVAVTGHVAPARAVLDPRFLLRMVI